MAKERKNTHTHTQKNWTAYWTNGLIWNNSTVYTSRSELICQFANGYNNKDKTETAIMPMTKAKIKKMPNQFLLLLLCLSGARWPSSRLHLWYDFRWKVNEKQQQKQNQIVTILIRQFNKIKRCVWIEFSAKSNKKIKKLCQKTKWMKKKKFTRIQNENVKWMEIKQIKVESRMQPIQINFFLLC